MSSVIGQLLVAIAFVAGIFAALGGPHVASPSDSLASWLVVPLELAEWEVEGGRRAAWTFHDDGRLALQEDLRGEIGLRAPSGFTLPEEFTFSVAVGMIDVILPDRTPQVEIAFHIQDNGVDAYRFQYGNGGNRHVLMWPEGPDETGSAGAFVPGATWDVYLKEWRRLTVVRTGETVRTYVDGERAHETGNVQLEGGGLALRTVDTAVVFSDIRLFDRALSQSEVRALVDARAEAARASVPERAWTLANRAESNEEIPPPDYAFTPAPGMTRADYYPPENRLAVPVWDQPAADRVGTPGYPVWDRPYEYPWPYGPYALPYWRAMKYGTLDIKTTEIRNAYWPVSDSLTDTEIRPNEDGEIRWPLSDSYGEPIQWVHRPTDANGNLQPYWYVYDGENPDQRIAGPILGGISISVQGPGAMYPADLAQDYALVAFGFGSYRHDGWRINIRAFLPRAALPDRFGPGGENDIDTRGMGNGGTSLERVLDVIPVPASQFPAGWSPMGRTGERAGNYSNYEAPRGRFMPFMGNTTGIAGGGIIRGIAKAGYDHIFVYDYFPYLDANVDPRRNPPVAQWVYGQIVRPDGEGGWIETGMFGFIPFSITDGEPLTFEPSADS